MNLKRLREYLGVIGYDDKRKVLPILLISALVALTEIAAIGIIFPIIQAFVDFEAFSEGKIAASLSRILGIEDMRNLSIVLVFVFMGMVLFRGAFTYLGYKKIFQVIADDEARFISLKFHELLYKDYIKFHDMPSSKIIRDLAVAIPIGFSNYLQGLLVIFSEFFVLIGVAIYLVLLDPVIFATIAVTLILSGLVYLKVIGPILRKLARDRHELTHVTIGIISQSIEGVMQIKNWQSEKFFSNWYLNKKLEQAKITSSLMAMQNVPRFYFETILVVGVCGALIYAFLAGVSSEEMLPILGFYVFAAFRSMPSVLRLSAQANTLSAAEPSIETIMNFDRNIRLEEKEKIQPFAVDKTLDFRDIDFSYHEDAPVLKDLSLHLTMGECVGIRGRSGEGKTTLVNLVSGLITPGAGSVLIDGQTLDNKDFNRFLATVGYVSQNTFILNDTLASNVAFGINKADIDEAKVRAALKHAQLEDYVQGLPNGIDEPVGERGAKLSGGQRQRIGIARAFYFDRQIFIFDEATASLDIETENRFIEVLRSLKGQKTIIVISHRLAPLSVCDTVYELKDGKLRQEQQDVKYA